MLVLFFLLYRPIGGDSVFGAGLAVAVVFIVIIVVVVVVLVVLYVTNKFEFRDKVQQLNTGIYMFNKNVYSTEMFKKVF